MSTRWPLPLIDTPPRDWPGMTLWASTVLLEAEGEPDAGKLAVAWVIRNRMDQKRLDERAVILAPYQFSCWNGDYAAMRRARLIAPDPVIWDTCWWAAVRAHFGVGSDPTHGADHYLNIALTRQMRGGHLPEWYREEQIVAEYGRHTFLKLVG